VYDDDQDTFCLDWWAPNYTKIKEMDSMFYTQPHPNLPNPKDLPALQEQGPGIYREKKQP